MAAFGTKWPFNDKENPAETGSSISAKSNKPQSPPDARGLTTAAAYAICIHREGNSPHRSARLALSAMLVISIYVQRQELLFRISKFFLNIGSTISHQANIAT
jgi:hypothetical protein